MKKIVSYRQKIIELARIYKIAKVLDENQKLTTYEIELELLRNRVPIPSRRGYVSHKIIKQNKSEGINNIEERIIKVLDAKIRPAVAKDGGDIKFKSFKDGVVHVELQGSCSGCPSSLMTLKQGVQNLLCHYVEEVKSVEAI